MCAARGLRGMVWRHAVGEGVRGEGKEEVRTLPLFVATTHGEAPADPDLTLRLAWLTAGLSDTAHFGLVEKRTEPAVANELLAGVVGRTGLATKDGPTAAGYLYAGWPTDPDLWAKLPGMLDSLILANEPGKNMPPDDPKLLAAKMFLAHSHRPVARLGRYTFGVSAGRDGTVVEVGPEFLVENPLGSAAKMEIVWPLPPGDFTPLKPLDPLNPDASAARPGAGMDVPAYGLAALPLKLVGHLDSIREGPKLSPLQLVERTNGASIELHAMVPVYRMRATVDPPKVDGTGSDWKNDAYFQAFGPMRVELGYQNRGTLLTGKVRKVEAAGVAGSAGVAEARWTFDKDYVYALIRCPQGIMGDERHNEWPVVGTGVGARWWGSDGVQVQMAGGGGGGGTLAAGVRVVQLGFKPSGIMVQKTATMGKDGVAKWSESSLAGLKYAVTTDKSGYTVELAIPRGWFPKDHDLDPTVPVWRVNVLRHVAGEMSSASWNGPVVGDGDVGMMGMLVGGD